MVNAKYLDKKKGFAPEWLLLSLLEITGFEAALQILFWREWSSVLMATGYP